MKVIISHLRDNDITYFDHMKRAVKWSATLTITGISLSVHAIFPFIFTHTASVSVGKINKEMNGNTCKSCRCEL